jgi:TolB-like protein
LVHQKNVEPKSIKMKKQIFNLLFLFVIPVSLMTNSLKAQQTGKPSLAIFSVDAKGIIQDAVSMGYLLRLEVEKTKQYNVVDRYEMEDGLKKNQIDPKSCFSKTCLVNAGSLLNVEKVMSGTVERFGEKIVVSLRLFDVASGNLEKSDATEYQNLQPEIQKMIEISVHKLLGLKYDETAFNMLVNYDRPIVTPTTTLNLNGPRMGASITLGDAGARLMAPKSKGGFDMFPVTSQFGWQHEFQYMSAGNFQALIECIFLVGGLENGKFIPSFSFLNGFRNSATGIEFAFGPTFRLIQKANGFYDTENMMDGGKGEWYMQNQWNVKDSNGIMVMNPYQIESRLDSRGDVKLSTGLVIAVGKTFKSGYLNIPVNAYCSPRKDGWIVGTSVGFNISKKPKVQ